MIIDKLKKALQNYEELDCKDNPPNARAIERKELFANLIQQYESNPSIDLVALLTTFKAEKQAISFFGGSRLMDHLQDALFNIFQIPPSPPTPYYGPNGGFFAIVDDLAKSNARNGQLETAIKTYLNNSSIHDHARPRSLFGFRVSV